MSLFMIARYDQGVRHLILISRSLFVLGVGCCDSRRSDESKSMY